MNTERISIEQDKNLEITVNSYFNEGQQNLLIIWVVLWTVAGIGIISQFFFTQLEDFTIYLIVWLAFWAYFEYKVIYAFRWRKYGLERIILKDEILYLSREISNRGIPQKYDVRWIKDLKVREIKDTNFIAAISKAYWNPGAEKIMFTYKGKDVFFGMELNENEAKKICKVLERKISEIDL